MENNIAYFPIALNLTYNAARDASNSLVVSVFGKYRRPPRQPLIIVGEFVDVNGYLRPRAHDGTLMSSVDINREFWAVYFPTPYCMQMQGLMSYFDTALKPFMGYRDIILRYQSLANKNLYFEYGTRDCLVQGDLDLFFKEDMLRYAGCRIGYGENWFS
jgi:hypothetical protein